MRGSHPSRLGVALAFAALGSALAGCSESFDNPFEGTCSASVADTLGTTQAGDPAGSIRLVVASSCPAGPTFGTLQGTGTWLVAPMGVLPGPVAIRFDGTYATNDGEILDLTISATGEATAGLGPVPSVAFSGTETFHGGTGIFDGSSGSATLSNGSLTAGGSSSWQFDGILTANNNEFEM